MRVLFHGLTPGVQDGEEPDLGAEAFWIGGHFEQGLGSWLGRVDRGMALEK